MKPTIPNWECPNGCHGKDLWKKWDGTDRHWGKWPPWEKWPIRWNNDCTRARCVVCGAKSDNSTELDKETINNGTVSYIKSG